jgi:hypothetical protein
MLSCVRKFLTVTRNRLPAVRVNPEIADSVPVNLSHGHGRRCQVKGHAQGAFYGVVGFVLRRRGKQVDGEEAAERSEINEDSSVIPSKDGGDDDAPLGALHGAFEAVVDAVVGDGVALSVLDASDGEDEEVARCQLHAFNDHAAGVRGVNFQDDGGGTEVNHCARRAFQAIVGFVEGGRRVNRAVEHYDHRSCWVVKGINKSKSEEGGANFGHADIGVVRVVPRRAVRVGDGFRPVGGLDIADDDLQVSARRQLARKPLDDDGLWVRGFRSRSCQVQLRVADKEGVVGEVEGGIGVGGGHKFDGQTVADERRRPHRG